MRAGTTSAPSELGASATAPAVRAISSLAASRAGASAAERPANPIERLEDDPVARPDDPDVRPDGVRARVGTSAADELPGARPEVETPLSTVSPDGLLVVARMSPPRLVGVAASYAQKSSHAVRS